MSADAGLTLTDATGTTVTIIAADPVVPSHVAVKVVEPAVRAVTSPLVFTLATAGALLVHVTVRPVSEVPLLSLGMAVN
jgi:hypothetical protein